MFGKEISAWLNMVKSWITRTFFECHLCMKLPETSACLMTRIFLVLVGVGVLNLFIINAGGFTKHCK